MDQSLENLDGCHLFLRETKRGILFSGSQSQSEEPREPTEPYVLWATVCHPTVVSYSYPIPSVTLSWFMKIIMVTQSVMFTLLLLTVNLLFNYWSGTSSISSLHNHYCWRDIWKILFVLLVELCVECPSAIAIWHVIRVVHH